MKKGIRIMIAYFHPGIAALLILAFVSMGAAGCAADSENMEDNGNTGNSEDIDIDSFLEIPLQEYFVDLTGDGYPDRIEIDLLGEKDDDIKQAEELVSRHARRISVRVTDGNDAEKVLYSRIFSGTHMENGQLLLVYENGRSYLMECSILEQMGDAVYEYSVFDFENSIQHFVDSSRVAFSTTQEAVERMKELGEDIVLREDAVPDFRGNIEKWFEGGVLLVGCDVMNYFYSEQEVYISDADTVYKPEDYFDDVWERVDD